MSVTPLPIRDGRVTDDIAVVVRAGVMAAGAAIRAAERTFDRHAVLGISVEGVIGRSVVDALHASPRLTPYRHVRLSTFGRVRASGFALLATFDDPHFTLVLPDLSELTIVRLQHAFDPPIANPGHEPRQ